jgi:N-acetylmuramoyl-L-alanine amidase
MIKKLSALALAGVLFLTGASSSLAYTVQSGDTMTKIANENSMSLHSLSELNPEIKNLDLIYVGQNVITNKNNSVETKVNTKVDTEVKVNATSSEIDLMARLVRAEATGEPYAGKVAVAYVVLNRVDSSQFPNSIEGVIYQKGQFSPVSNGAINKTADAESVKAVKEALIADRSDSQSLFFYNSRTATSRWLDSRPTVKVIGNHTFKK